MTKVDHEENPAVSIRNWTRLSLGCALAAALTLTNVGCGGGASGESEQDIAGLDVAPVYNEDTDSPLAGIDVTNESEHMETLVAEPE